MARFDFIEASAKGYEFVWSQKAFLTRVAIPVVYVKVASFLMIFLMQEQASNLMDGLILMPGYVLEGLFMIGLIRYFLYNEDIFVWGKTLQVPEGREAVRPYQGALTRLQCIQGGFAVYMLIKVVLLAFVGVMQDLAEMTPEPSQAAGAGPSPMGFLLWIAMFAIFLWIFRLVWMFIPTAMGMPIRFMLERTKGLDTAAYMFGTWLTCFLPSVVFMFILLGLGVAVFGPNTPASVILTALFFSGFEVFVTAVSIIAMTIGFHEILYGNKQDK